MLHILDSSNVCNPTASGSVEGTAYLNIKTSTWHRAPKSSSPELTSACFCKNHSNQYILLSCNRLCRSKHLINLILTRSNSCSLRRLASPPQKSEVPSTSKRLESMEPTKEHLTTSILPWCRANKAIMSSVAFPHVALRSPPTVYNNIIIHKFHCYCRVFFDRKQRNW